MLVLFETPAGYALFNLLDDGKLHKPDELEKAFASSESANKAIKLRAFSKFENTTDAMAAVTGIVEGKVPKNLKKFLDDEIGEAGVKKETLIVGDAKLGASIAKKLGIKVLSDSTTNELLRGIRSQLESLLSGIPSADLRAMQLGLAHSLSRYKLKFSPDKVDTMVVQAISLLDDLDKELNTYAMRVKEWYGWHFPEMSKIVVDNVAYARVVKLMGVRTNAAAADLSTILPEELELQVKTAAEISMGTEISPEDVANITYLCDQVVSLSDYRASLSSYLRQRMNALAPNLTAMVGELVGARLIAHAGSLINLAKYPASTVQILGAEKALFRALKTKHDTPKYGLLFHASLVGQAAPKHKGKMARVVATKASLSARVDALGETTTPDLGISLRAVAENRLRHLEGRAAGISNKSAAKGKPKQDKVELTAGKSYNTAGDAVGAPAVSEEKKEKKEKKDKKEKKGKKDEDAMEVDTAAEAGAETNGEKKKKKKEKREQEDRAADGEERKEKKVSH
ncbi:Nop domain-containing protein [Gonapodya prolifera JEL478]|uniref:Nucleolar protein 58 n=1 Tax=Gonapodya prolifera (strain JEL478) TaxID=1344416 RepID=A0A139AI73_GONPJ|nr:Nop domain-containing protein [Gonapodya prolifera JEL478]|eukprot:KXS16409.1 Nop domain-containing protein [Gonapodya prolifera JEL478]